MAKTEPFDKFPDRYELWFERYHYTYLSELEAVKKAVPEGKGIEIGVGSGRFAAPLYIRYGVEPSLKMAKIAKEKGIYVVRGVAEYLPIKNFSFDFVLFVTTICFVDDIKKSFEESFRILKPYGKIIIGFIDKNSPLGVFYQKNREKNPFYRYATFFSTEEVLNLLQKTGFGNFKFFQTVFDFPEKISKVQTVKEGYGEGSFVVVTAEKIDR
ncbi:Ubiquinone/menaquinone biosynthesis C-methylase UbiE [Persephonella hydrogeniphila]|uniref:Ubiquinone/menaquinone biosynthesis C-methylase UbiE n=1 Tax=Persephonella hydrogeniphila TaxID=198703 RepID=A0A285MYD7_9AQUI|nr:class I SAM-dependent methyltransferase [Persephonella hydrogeniphila]SNZ02202.1 Ubiquinone/menaquinone biosynthesis C-methylase UbiE [Persephonella hydrogeniphila]